MRGGKVRKFVIWAGIAAAVAAVVSKLRGEPAPQFSNHPSVNGGPDSSASAPAPVTSTSAPTTPKPKAAPAATPKAPADTSDRSPTPAWVDPVDGACPDGYPIKAKLKSGIFHQPGGTAYERTAPDRCYSSPEAAEADGLRAAKR